MKKFYFVKTAIIVVMTALMAVACDNQGEPENTELKIEISLDKETIFVGELANITVNVEGKTEEEPRLSLNEEGYDFVAFEGLSAVKGIAAGKAIVIASIGDVADSCEIVVVEMEVEADAKIVLNGSFAGGEVEMFEFPIGSGMYQSPMVDFATGDTFQVKIVGSETTVIGVASEGENVSYPSWRAGVSSMLVKNFSSSIIGGAAASISSEQAGKQIIVYDSKLSKIYMPAWSFAGQVEGSNWDAYLPLVIYEDAVSVAMADGQFVMFHVLVEGEWKIWSAEEQAYYGLNTSEYIDGDEMYPMNTMRLPIWDPNLNGGAWKNGIMNVTKDGEAFRVEGEWIQEYRIVIQPVPYYVELPGDFAMSVQLPAGDDSVE